MPRCRGLYDIGDFTYDGTRYQYTGLGYAVDSDGTSARVWKFGVRLASARLTDRDGNSRVFNAIRLLVTVRTREDAGITGSNGIRVTDSGVYDRETPRDRRALIRSQRRWIDSRDDAWLPAKYAFRGEPVTVFEKYESHTKSLRVRNAKTKRELRKTAGGYFGLYVGGTRKRMVSARGIWMCTHRSENRRPDQTQIDHVNGAYEDERPENFRWASPLENRNFVFRTSTRMAGRDKYTDDTSGLKEFRGSGWKFGTVGSEYVILDSFGRRVTRFRTTPRHPYPTVRIRGTSYPVHRIVSTMETRLEPGMIVRHLNACKTDFRPCNLAPGTLSQNATDTQANPATSQKVCRSKSS